MLLVALAIFGLAVGLFMIFRPGDEYDDDETTEIRDAVDRAIAFAATLPAACRHEGGEGDCPALCEVLYGNRYAEVVWPGMAETAR